MFIFSKLQEILSIYIVLMMLFIGLYMRFVQTKSLDTVNHLEKEARFTKIVGTIYIILGFLSGIILIL